MPAFYVGVSRYFRRRWLGGDDLAPEDAHSSKWTLMYMITVCSLRVGDLENRLIKSLQDHYGKQRCYNCRGGGGGSSPYKPSGLYVCVGSLQRAHGKVQMLSKKRARRRLVELRLQQQSLGGA